MDHSSRASSTSTGREVRCGCQYFKTDSLLPEKSALKFSSRSPFRYNNSRYQLKSSFMDKNRFNQHNYESLIMVQLRQQTEVKAPVVRITDTDTVPVADSDDSLEYNERWKHLPILEGDVVLPLDGRIEDNEMDGKNFGDHTIDTQDEDEETAQQFQNRLEQSFKISSTPGADSRTDAEINTSQVDSSIMEELPLRRGARGFFKNQAGKIRSRFKGIQKPTFTRHRKTEKPQKSPPIPITQSSPKPQKASRMERFKMALPERPKINLPNKSKFKLPDRSKFHIKRPNIHLPASLSRQKKSKSDTLEETDQTKTDSTHTSRTKIFDFSTYPRPKFFEKRSKQSSDYVTSTPKETRNQTFESSTFPRVKKKSLTDRWSHRFGETTKHPGEEDTDHVIERTTPWRHPSLEQPRLSLKPQISDDKSDNFSWEKSDNRIYDLDVDTDKSRHTPEIVDEIPKVLHLQSTYDKEPIKDPKLDDEAMMNRITKPVFKKSARLVDKGEVQKNKQTEDGLINYFPPVDPREFPHKDDSGGLSDEESMRSDKEMQQSSGSSCERRRRGIIDDNEEDTQQASRQEKSGFKFIHGIRDAIKSRKFHTTGRSTKKLKKRKNIHSLEPMSISHPPEKPVRTRSSKQLNKEINDIEIVDKHEVMYHTDITSNKNEILQPLGNVIKPLRKKSKSSLSALHRISAPEQNILTASMDFNQKPPVPCRKKRLRRDQSSSLSIRTVDSMACNGFADFKISRECSRERIPPPTPPPTPPGPRSHQSYLQNEEEEFIKSPPVPPKRRSHSRGTSMIQDDDRTSQGAESLPELGYLEDDVTPRSSSQEPSFQGYATIERRDKSPKPTPPRRKHQRKFATVPRRPKHRSPTRSSLESMPFADDYDNLEGSRELTSAEILNRMRDRPLPAPPRPPRTKRNRRYFRDISPEFSENATSIRTDPLPDDCAREFDEEITRGTLVVTPSRSGSQIFISTERIPSPTQPPVPPLPHKQRDIEKTRTDEKTRRFDESIMPTASQLNVLRSALFSTDEPLRISNLEVADLKVEKLTVSQLEAYKIAASEIDAIVVSAAEVSSKGETEGSLHPSLLQELIAIRNHLQTVTESQSQSRPGSAMSEAHAATSSSKSNLVSEDKVQNQTLSNKKMYSRESSPYFDKKDSCETLLTVQSTLNKEATDGMGRTIYSSIPDLTITSDNTIEKKDLVATPEPDEEVTNITSRRSDSRSRSASPSHGISGAVRQTASPVKSLPPVISVTPDTSLRPITSSGVETKRAVISYTSNNEEKQPSIPRDTSSSPPPVRESSSSPIMLLRETSQSPSHSSTNVTQFIAFPTSQIPSEFFSLANPSSSLTSNNQRVEVDPNVLDMTMQLLRALKIAGTQSLRNFVDSVVSRFGSEDSDKVRQVELALCALLVLIAGLILLSICSPKTVMHHHHWEYFNPPQ